MSLNLLTPERIDPPDIWMTGDPNVTHKVCCAYRPTNPECNDKAWACGRVMIEAHLGRYGVTYFCRSHLDLLGEMILHTRRLREARSESDDEAYAEVWDSLSKLNAAFNDLTAERDAGVPQGERLRNLAEKLRRVGD